jgi:hypothetical protein
VEGGLGQGGLGVSGGWALLVCGATLSRTAPQLVPARHNGGPDPSFLSGVVWAARIVAAVGDGAIDAAAGGTVDGAGAAALTSVPPAGPGGTSAPSPLRARAEAVTGQATAALAAAAVLGGFSAQAAEELASLIPGCPPGTSGAALCAAGVWLSEDAAGVTAALTRRRGLARGPLRYAPDGCGFAAALLAQAGLALLG